MIDVYTEREIQEFIDKHKPDFVIRFDGGPRELIMLRYQGDEEVVTIPKGINVIGCEYLGRWSEYYGFFSNKKINKVIMQDGVNYIGTRSFAGCTNLKTLILPNSLKWIGTQAFAYCESLENIDLCNDISLLEETFIGCSKLKKVTFFNNIYSIGKNCFKGCENLEKLEFPNIYEIGEGAFFENKSLKTVIFKGGVNKIGKNCFAKNENIEEVLFLNSNPDKSFHFSIEDAAFFGSKKLKKIVFPNNLVKIGTLAFAQCHLLEEVILPESLIEVGNSAFYNCKSLKEIILPSNIEVLPRDTFYGCTSLKRVSLPQNLKEIGEQAFHGCENIEKLNLPKGLKKIGNFAFWNCRNLSNISLTEGLEEIGYCAFGGCPNISSVELPLTIKKIATHSFDNTKVRKYTVRSVPFNIFRVEYGEVDFLKKGNWVDAIQLVSQDKEILKQVILGIPEEDLKSCFWDKINLESFQSNLEVFREIGIPEEKISDLFVNNGEFLTSKIDSILDNYNYLNNQNIIDSDDLQKLFFRSFNLNETNRLNGKNIEEQKKILKRLIQEYYHANQQLPPLLNRLACASNDKEKLELRDALTYINHMELVDFGNSKKLEHATKILTRTVFETIVEEDRLAYEKDLEISYKGYIEYNENYNKYFVAIKSPFYRKLSGINERLFNYFMEEMNNKNAGSTFAKFFDSLTTVQNWESHTNHKLRATLLKNEIIGRILYACLSYEQEKNININDIAKADFLEIMEKATGSPKTIFTDESLIERMLEIDPYSFDALRNDTHELEYKYCVKAKKSGYLFSDEETKHYSEIVNGNDKNKIKEYNDFKQYIEYINNEIGIPKIRKEDKEEYLRRTRIIAKRYLYENKEDDLFSLLRLTDLYLRSNSGYISISAKGDIIETTAKEVFDFNSSISQKDRLLYMMYNLNRLAHNITDLNLKVDFVNNRTTNKEEFKNIEQAIKSLDELSRFGFDLSIVYGIVSFNTENDTISDDDYSTLKILIRDGGDDSRLIDNLKLSVTKKYTDTINQDTIEVIRSNLNTLLSLSATGFLNQTNKEKIRNYAEERALFFDVKAIVAEELLNLTVDKQGSEICQFIDMSKKEKIAFYHKNGYIMEIQKDDNNDATLVCYSKTYRETFSIHLKSMPPKLHKKVFDYINSARYEATLANTRLKPPGITLRRTEEFDPSSGNKQLKEKFNPNYGKKQLKEVLSGGFHGDTTEYATALYNYMEYDLYDQIEELKIKQKSIKDGTCDSSTLEYFEKLNVDKWFECFDEINSLKYAEKKKTILDRIKDPPEKQTDIHCLGVKAENIKKYEYEIKEKIKQRTIPTEEETVNVLKRLNLHFGTLKTGIKTEEAEIPKKK